MKDKYKEFCIESAITEYKNAMCFGIPNIGTMSSLISMLKNTENMCSPYNIEGIGELRSIIKDAEINYTLRIYFDVIDTLKKEKRRIVVNELGNVPDYYIDSINSAIKAVEQCIDDCKKANNVTF